MKAAELRQSILQAAVQGKLVPQNPNDEPASELLERIQHEKARLVKEGKIKKEKPLPPITEDEVPYDLPDGWVWCRLMDIFDIRDGTHDTPKYVQNGIPLITSKNLQNGIISFDNIKCISIDDHKKISMRSHVDDGDILFAMIGSIGNPVIVKKAREFSIKNVALFKFYNSTIYDNAYLFLFLRASEQIMKDTSSGGVQSFVSLTYLRNYLIPFPPLAEQQRIVAKVDELIELCDELEASEKELDELEIHLAEYLPKAILQAAVQGKLVPQNVHDEPASELLKRIRQEKERLVKEGKIKKEKPIPPIAEDEMPYDLPDGWIWCRLGDVCSINPRNQIPDDTEVSFTPMVLISNDYFEGHKQEMRQWGEVKSGFTHYAENDVVVAKITPCFQNGKSCIMRNLKNGYGAGTTELHVLRSTGVQPAFLLIYVKHPKFLLEGERNMTGTAGQQRIPTDYLKMCLFPLPPLAEQQRIVSKIDELMALCDELKNARSLLIKTAASNVVPFQPKEDNDEEQPRGQEP